ncbi:hypothetical protein AVEN_179871-1 [Araneus ventricosus]|uniref:Neurogenic mastermind-like N-terminal domain-containing protein n=1 Tax=Araneus ventricosus TaxID=182803 RepID=A0A4Y2KM03_ARAVE|nr:hypothetical protein AVEN_179871-1 [Araneus ventricosus]
MGDVLTPKRQTVVDRLKRRFDLYRRHQNDCVPRYEQAANCLYENQRQDTIVLKQRFLESKAKKAKSKNDHHRTYKDTVSDGSKTQLVYSFSPYLSIGCTDQNAVEQISCIKYIENSPVVLISSSLAVISFNEMTPQNMKTMTMKRGQKKNDQKSKKLCKSNTHTIDIF